MRLDSPREGRWDTIIGFNPSDRNKSNNSCTSW